MSMTKDYLFSLPAAEQDKILGPVYGDDWAGYAENEPTASEESDLAQATHAATELIEPPLGPDDLPF